MSTPVLPVPQAIILSFDLAALVFILTASPLWVDDRADAARARTARNDEGRVLLLLIILLVITVLLLALGWMVTLHGVFAFLFNLGVLNLTINVLSSVL